MKYAFYLATHPMYRNEDNKLRRKRKVHLGNRKKTLCNLPVTGRPNEKQQKQAEVCAKCNYELGKLK